MWVSLVSGAPSITEHKYMVAPLDKSCFDRGLVIDVGGGERFWKLFTFYFQFILTDKCLR